MSLTPEHFMAIAQVVSTAGTCDRLQVGAVLVLDRRIIATGYNGAPAGMSHCTHIPDLDESCSVAVHAELNAIAFSARHGITTAGSVLYVTHEPCLKCAQAIVNAGIRSVLYHKEYRLHDGTALLEAAKVPVGRVDRPELFLVPDSRGDGSGVHPGQHADQAFEEGWSRAKGRYSGGGAGSTGGKFGEAVLGSGWGVPE